MLTGDRGTAWKLAITCSNIIDESRVTPAMRYFADNVRLRDLHDRAQVNGDISGLRLHHARNELKVESYTLNTHYRYLLKPSTYVVEVTKTQKYRESENSKANNNPLTWRASMYHLDWDAILDRQSSLRIGESGQWDAKLDTFFPPDSTKTLADRNKGVEQFLEKVCKASQLVQHKTSSGANAIVLNKTSKGTNATEAA